eukprot:Hpha_TRINITY_DN12397_c0_g2::TRINITY_DN12397_c0_g2_i1::g.155792::m.155792/K16550/RPGRIP1L; protein fantom
MPQPLRQVVRVGVRAHAASGPRPSSPHSLAEGPAGSIRDHMRERITDLQDENVRLKKEAMQRDTELTVIRQRFGRIVEELQRRDAGVPIDGGGDPPPPLMNRGKAENRDAETYMAEQNRRLQLARRETDDLKRLVDQLQSQRDTWQKKYKYLRAELKRKEQPQIPPSRGGKVARGTGVIAASTLAPGMPVAPETPLKPLQMSQDFGPDDALPASAYSPPPSGRVPSGRITPRSHGFTHGAGGREAAHMHPHATPTPQKQQMAHSPLLDSVARFESELLLGGTIHGRSPTCGTQGRIPHVASMNTSMGLGHIKSPRQAGCDAATSPHHQPLAAPLPVGAIVLGGSGPAAVQVTTAVQTAAWPQLVAYERSLWEQEAAQRQPGLAPPPPPAPSGVIEVLQRENGILEQRVRAAGDQLAAAEARCQRFQDERDLLINAAGGDPSKGGDGGLEEKHLEQLQLLQQELSAKNAQLVMLDARFKQATSSVNDLKRANEQILEEMRRMNESVAQANQRALEAENAAQVAAVGAGRVESLESMLKDKETEVRELMVANRDLMTSCHTSRTQTETALRTEWEDRLEQRERALEESERNNRRLFRDAQAQEQHMEQLRRDLAKIRREREEGRDEVVKLQEQVRDQGQRLKIMGADGKVSEQEDEDVHKALALIQHHRRKGDPTDLQFLMTTWDSGAAEMQDLRGENLRLLREVEEARKMLKVWQDRHSRDAEKLEGMRRAEESRKKLTEVQRDQIWNLQTEVAQHVGRVVKDSDASSVVTQEGENVVELGLGHLRVTPGLFDRDPPPTFFVSADFFDFETVISSAVSGVSAAFDQTFCFTVDVSEELRHCVRNGSLDIELNQKTGLSFEVVGRASIPLKKLANPNCPLRHSAHLKIVDASGTDIGELEYHIALKAPLPVRWGEDAETVSAVSEVASALPARVWEAFRGTTGLRVQVNSARDLHRASSTEPIPYVLITADPPSELCADATAEMERPRRTYHPTFRWDHIWEGLVPDTNAVRKYLKSVTLHFIILDDAAEDPRAPPLGRATLALAPLLEGPGQGLDTALPLMDTRGVDVGSIDVALRWVKDLDGLAPFQ